MLKIYTDTRGYILLFTLIVFTVLIITIAFLAMFGATQKSDNYENSFFGRCHNGDPSTNGCTNPNKNITLAIKIACGNSSLSNVTLCNDYLNKTRKDNGIPYDPFTGGRGGAYYGGRGW